MDLILKNARTGATGDGLVDIGITGGRIVAIESDLVAAGETLDVGGCLVSPGFVETHIHLDKSCIMDRCRAERGDLAEAIEEVAKAKRGFTPEDVYARAKRSVEKAIAHGTTHMRTQLEIDPVVGHKGLEGVLPLIEQYKWAIDIEICVFPQDGLLNLPGTEDLMRQALTRGASVVGACPYTDSDPIGQIDRVFAMAREFDRDIDMHLDFDLMPDETMINAVCKQTAAFRYGGRVTVGHVTRLSAMPPEQRERAARRMADAGVALIVMPSTDLYLMGRTDTHNVPRGMAPAHDLLGHGVNCAISTNNVLNPFTPYGDGSLIRMANLYANVAQIGTASQLRDCFDMVTTRSARLMNLENYGLHVGARADLVVLDCATPQQAIAELAPVLYAFKHGRRTVTRLRPALHRS